MSDRFRRVFEGHAEKQDLAVLAQTYECRVAVVTAQDGAWNRDAFATSDLYTLVESQQNRWRIYVATGKGTDEHPSP
jgi:hypothetical protein